MAAASASPPTSDSEGEQGNASEKSRRRYFGGDGDDIEADAVPVRDETPNGGRSSDSDRDASLVKDTESKSRCKSKVGGGVGKAGSGKMGKPRNFPGSQVTYIESVASIHFGDNINIEGDYYKGRSKSHSKKQSKKQSKAKRSDDNGAGVISPEVLRCVRAIDDSEIELIEDQIGKCWMALGRALGFKDGELEALESDYGPRNLKEVVHQMLVAWQRRESKEATVGALAAALLKTDRAGIANDFCV